MIPLYGATRKPVRDVAAAARLLLGDMLDNRLEVELFPARYPRYPGHMTRVATAANPVWYRRLAASVAARGRRPGRCSTGIRRRAVASALGRFIAGTTRGTSYERLVAPAITAARYDSGIVS